jgi:hypothetical protein
MPPVLMPDNISVMGRLQLAAALGFQHYDFGSYSNRC